MNEYNYKKDFNMNIADLINGARQNQITKLSIEDNDQSTYRAMLQLTSYIVEETVEVNRELHHHYKPFKAAASVDKDKLIEEIADIIIYAAGLASLAGSGEEVTEFIINKLNKNSSRTDHIL